MGHTGVPILSIEVVSMLGTLIHTKFKKIKNGKKKCPVQNCIHPLLYSIGHILGGTNIQPVF